MKPNRMSFAGIARIALLFAATAMCLSAQPRMTESNTPGIRIGVLGALNDNTAPHGMQYFVSPPNNPGFAAMDMSNSNGLGAYLGIVLQGSYAGIIDPVLRVSYDDRRTVGKYSGNELDVRLEYVAVEPGARFNIGSTNLHATLGGAILANVTRTYDYHPAFAEGAATVNDEELTNARRTCFGAWGGVGYDVLLNPRSTSARWFVTPFVEASYLFDQMQHVSAGPTDKSWSTLTLRGGVELSVELSPSPSGNIDYAPPPLLGVTVTPPRNGVAGVRDVAERFPLLNYVFFDSGSVELPDRYVRLSSSQALTFDERAIREPVKTGEQSTPTHATRQMSIYDNMINVIAARMAARPATKITLVGSAPEIDDARAMAEQVKEYMVGVFPITPERIQVRAQALPPHASGTRATPKEDRWLVAEENRRVEIMSNDAGLVAPVELRTLAEEPFDNDLRIDLKSTTPIASWIVTIVTDHSGETFGPYHTPRRHLNAGAILGDRPSGTYAAMVTATTTSGDVVTTNANFSLNRRAAPSTISGRYSILFEFDESKTVAMYENFLRRDVAPMIPNGATVFIHGHTDIIGEEDYNSDLSRSRADGAAEILKDELRKLGRAVVMDVAGFGEAEEFNMFSNDSPQNRYYNRTVVIDIIPGS